jgi:flagellar motility protein MotE (MotC chaperone)
MKAKNAAAIFDTMTDDFDLVCEILQGMDASTRADILAAMSAENAAIITKMMEP